MKYKNLTLIGTSHIAKESLKEVEKVIRKQEPDFIALELDPRRLHALLAKKKRKISIRDIRRVGIKGYFFALIGGWAEKKLGESVGVSPGAEMLKAVKLAKELKIPLLLIDQDIEITLRRFSQTLTWKEKWNFLVDLFNGFVLRKKIITFDLTKVPSQKIIKKLTKEVEKRYPNIYKVLVVERNHVMARRLAFIMKKEPDKEIIAIIGAGHEKEMLQLIKRYLKPKTAK